MAWEVFFDEEFAEWLESLEEGCQGDKRWYATHIRLADRRFQRHLDGLVEKEEDGEK